MGLLASILAPIISIVVGLWLVPGILDVIRPLISPKSKDKDSDHATSPDSR